MVSPGRHVLFEYTPRHDSDAVDTVLAGYEGYLVADAHAVYDHLYADGRVTEVNCWAHARRYFFKALTSDPERARQALDMIGGLFKVERAIATSPRKKRERIRAKHSKPIVERFFSWCDAERHRVLDDTPIADGIRYARNQREGLSRFLTDGRLPLHNNLSELNLRRQAVGRKNWLFVGSDDGGRVNATFTSLLASCRMHDVEPWSYLRDLFCLLPGWSRHRVLELSPLQWQATREDPDVQARLPEKRALDQALSNAETPTSVHLDALGREIATVEVVESAAELEEEQRLDVRGLSGASVDRRGLTASTRTYDRLGRLVLETSMDAGAHRSLFDAEGREVKHWREDTLEARSYDLAGRITERRLTDGATTWLAERMTYGEGASGAADRNQRGRLVLLEDAAGTEATTRYGAFGEPLHVERTLTATPGLDPDWDLTVPLESTAHVTRSVFDALGRRPRAFLADGSERQEDYHRSGGLAEARVVLAGEVTARVVITGTTYNARGQRLFHTLGNGVEVTSAYDDETFRLYQRRAIRPGTPDDLYQDLRHHYDPVGNLVYLNDLAQTPSATHVIHGLTVEAHRTYSYDARYQLTAATGRVHDALMQPDYRGDMPVAGTFRGTRRLGLSDGGVVGRYRRTFSYDAGGNLLGWVHGQEPGTPKFVQAWTFDKWASSTSNRTYPLLDPSGIPYPDPASKFDARGQIVELPYVRAMEWSPRDHLRRAVAIERPGGTDDDERYDYAADQRRLRKVTRREVAGLTETHETVYLDGCELRRVTRGSTLKLERWTSHVALDENRVASLYQWSKDDDKVEVDSVPATRGHYHLGTRLGSVSLELGEAGELLAYEEYFPFGRTSMVAGDAVREVALRTLRFVGKNQDDLTAFYAFQYRYYAPFIGNWVSPDPAGEVDGLNTYQYARNNPVRFVDPEGTDSEDLQFFGPELETYEQAVEYLQENSVFYTEEPVLREREGGSTYWFVGRFVQDASRGVGGRVSAVDRAEIQVDVLRRDDPYSVARIQAEDELSALRGDAPTVAGGGDGLGDSLDALGGGGRPIDTLEYARRQSSASPEAATAAGTAPAPTAAGPSGNAPPVSASEPGVPADALPRPEASAAVRTAGGGGDAAIRGHLGMDLASRSETATTLDRVSGYGDGPATDTGQPADDLSPALRGAWESAEEAGYDTASVDRLIEQYERERGEQDLLTAQSVLEYASVRATAAVRNWEQGNYGQAIGHGAVGLVESFGYGLGVFGRSTGETIRNAVVNTAVGLGIGKIFGAAAGALRRRGGGLQPPAAGGARGSWGGRTFDPANAGGPVRSLSTDGVRVTSRGIDVVEGHLARFGPDAANQGMVSRLRDIAAGRLKATQADLNFYTHELREFVRYRRLGHRTGAGDNYDLWNNAHSATLADYGLVEGPGVLYHPSVAP